MTDEEIAAEARRIAVQTLDTIDDDHVFEALPMDATRSDFETVLNLIRTAKVVI